MSASFFSDRESLLFSLSEANPFSPVSGHFVFALNSYCRVSCFPLNCLHNLHFFCLYVECLLISHVDNVPDPGTAQCLTHALAWQIDSAECPFSETPLSFRFWMCTAVTFPGFLFSASFEDFLCHL